MTLPIAPASSGTPAVSDILSPADAALDTELPSLGSSSIADASKAFRDRIEQAAIDGDPLRSEPKKEEVPTPDPLRNADGTFAAKEPAEAVTDEAVAAVTADTTDAEAEVEEAKVFTLKGETQRGETDLELDVTGLPPEAVERLERLEKQGMRRAEFDAEMRKVRADRTNLDALETEMAVDPEGFMLNRIAPARRVAVAETLLMEQFDALAPMIEELWNNPEARYQKLENVRNKIALRRGEVQTTVAANQAAAEIRTQVSGLIPDTASSSEAEEFFATSIALMQQMAMKNDKLTPADVPTLLAAHRRRFFGAGDTAPAPSAPVRPKLAVKQTPGTSTRAASPPTTVLTPAQVAAQIKGRNAARAVAPMGAGTTSVQRPGGPANESIEAASKRLRALRTA